MTEVPSHILKEAKRLLGMSGGGDKNFAEQAGRLYSRLVSASAPKHTTARVDIRRDNNVTDFGAFRVKSADLARLFENCSAAVLIASTLGAGVDRLICRVQKEDMADAVVIDALASAYADSRCDEVEDEAAKALSDGEHFTMRFSPGYGDVPLETSNDIITLLDAGRRIGLSTTASNMLVPVKSITAFLGVADRKAEERGGCELCSITETCVYRKKGWPCGIHG